VVRRRAPAWLQELNFYRATARPPRVAEDPALSEGARRHAEYIVRDGLYQHYEDPSAAHYSNEGDDAGRNSNIVGGRGVTLTDRQAIANWMSAPFHALGILDPRLVTVGYGSFRDPEKTPYKFAAALDVGHGLAERAPEWIGYPIRFPGPGSTVNVQRFMGESPDPLTACAGYRAPTGLPIVIQFAGPTEVHSARVLEGGRTVESCVFDATTYTNPEPADEAEIRDELDDYHAAIIVPRRPLAAGRRYDVAIETASGSVAWSFTTGREDEALAWGANELSVDPTHFADVSQALRLTALIGGLVAAFVGPGPARRRWARAAWFVTLVVVVWAAYAPTGGHRQGVIVWVLGAIFFSALFVSETFLLLATRGARQLAGTWKRASSATAPPRIDAPASGSESSENLVKPPRRIACRHRCARPRAQ
jgi:Cysteine-rich secretory protein family